MAGLRDVARLAGVSLGTAACTFNGRQHVSEATRSRVLAAAGALRYQARPRAARRGPTVTIITHRLTTEQLMESPFDGEIAQAILHEVTTLGGTVETRTITADNAAGIFAGPGPAARSSAYIVVGIYPEWLRIAFHRRHFSIPVVLVSETSFARRFDCVSPNDASAAAHLGVHAARARPGRFILLRGPQAYSSFRDRHRALREALLGPSLRLDPRLVASVDCADGLEAGYAAAATVAAVWQSAPAPHTHVLAAHDMQALGLLAGLEALGIRVPESLSVAGYDDITRAGQSDPALTTVHVPRHLLGRIAVDLVRARLDGQCAMGSAPVAVTVAARLVERARTAWGTVAPHGRARSRPAGAAGHRPGRGQAKR